MQLNWVLLVPVIGIGLVAVLYALRTWFRSREAARAAPTEPPAEINLDEARKGLEADREWAYNRRSEVIHEIGELEKQIRDFQKQRSADQSQNGRAVGLADVICDASYANLILANLETVEKLQAHLAKLTAIIGACKRLLADVRAAQDLKRPMFFKNGRVIAGLSEKIKEAADQLKTSFETVDKSVTDSEFSLRLGEPEDKAEIEKRLKRFETNGMLKLVTRQASETADELSSAAGASGQAVFDGQVGKNTHPDNIEAVEKPVRIGAEHMELVNDLAKLVGLPRTDGESDARFFTRVRSVISALVRHDRERRRAPHSTKI